MKPITYISDQAGDYSKAVRVAANLAELVAVLADYKEIFPDALAQAPTNDAEFNAWRAGVKKETRGKFAGEAFMDRFGALLIPALMLQVGMISSRFMAPWGCAFIRCQEAGKIARDASGSFRWVD